MATARVLTTTEGQVVRLPEEFHIDAEELEVIRRGNEIVLRERDLSAVGISRALAAMYDDFFADGRRDSPPQERNWLQVSVKNGLA